MNKKKPPIIGIDVSMRTFNARICGEDKEYPNNGKGWRSLVKDSPPEAVFAMEATGYYHFRLASFLHSKQKIVYVCNPLFVKLHIRSQGSKSSTDRLDSVSIADYMEKNRERLRPWEPVPAALGRARMIIAAIANLQKQKVMNRNLRHALSVGFPEDSILSVPVYLCDVLESQIDELGSELSSIMERLYPREYAGILSIPGIGSLTASVLLAVTDCMKNFIGHKQLCSFLGLVPHSKDSGETVRVRGGIVKCGNHYLRALLFLSAFSASRCNPSLAGFYNGLVARGKPKRVAVIAVAHRLVRIAFGVVKSGEPYRGKKFREVKETA